MNKPIEDYDLIETICDNDQASGHYAIPSGSHIGTHMECNLEQEVFPPTQHFVDMSFGKTDAYGNTSPFAQPNTSEPVSATSPIQSKKQKGKHIAHDTNDAINNLVNTIKNGFESVKSRRSVSFAREL